MPRKAKAFLAMIERQNATTKWRLYFAIKSNGKRLSKFLIESKFYILKKIATDCYGRIIYAMATRIRLHYFVYLEHFRG
ncbi:hypothetical protein [Helicobacter rodentium]|uniref:hypothetical protein n=1 Tax=Helicobacter rodentium TaxID=59617 RepID=UPI0023545F28|nr:hypothetical protein [Helicobacter rodentium]